MTERLNVIGMDLRTLNHLPPGHIEMDSPGQGGRVWFTLDQAMP